MEDGVMSVIKTGNVIFQYDRPERTEKDIKKENRRLLFSIIAVVLFIFVFFGIYIFCIPVNPEVEKWKEGFAIILTLTIFYIVLWFIGYIGFRFSYGDKRTRQINEIIDYFLFNKLTCGWFDGKIKIEVCRNTGVYPAIIPFKRFIHDKFDKISKVEFRDESTIEKPMKVVISTLFDAGITVVTIVDDEKEK